MSASRCSCSRLAARRSHASSRLRSSSVATPSNLGSPPERGSVYRFVPEPGELLVELEESHRESSHLQARDVAANKGSRDLHPAALQDLRDAVERDVELDEWRATHAVHEHECVVAAFEGEVVKDRREKHLRDVVNRSEL